MPDEYLILKRYFCYRCKGTGSLASAYNRAMLSECPHCQGTGKREKWIPLTQALEEQGLVVLPRTEALELSVRATELERR